ncbi:serine hydrolase [Pseudidiomarina sp.]|uniref:serine hydrolase n=1 Tax=Pseudidiomarina sp. TaxID=2081707 RepID=UPI00299E6FA0|nr:serine hydrolase [Pseudidiomarina sp.]MDX1706627.1 serine hydrolase [Pseudidiomarina sp.]
MEKNAISERLVYQRKLKGLSQEQLAEKTQVTVRTIQRLEKGEVTPHLRTVKMLAAALDVEVDDLLQLDDPRNESIQKKWLLLLHSAPFVGFVIPLMNILLPLFIWIHKREDNPLYDRHGRAVINFQITMALVYLFTLIALVTIQGYGFFFFIAVIPYAVLVMLANVVAVLKSNTCYYPLAIPFLKIKKPSLPGTAAVLCLVGLSALFANPQAAAQTSATKSEITAQTQQFEDFLLAFKKEKYIPGLSVAVVKDGQLVYEKAHGVSHLEGRVPVTNDTPFWIASVSKFFVGTTFLKLVEEGELSLDDRVSDMPEFKEYCQWLAGSGIIFGKNLQCDQVFKLKHALNHVVNGKVDTEFFYNSIYYSRLSRFLEAKRGNSIEEAKGRHNELAQAITTYIFEPAGMTNSIAGLWDDNRKDVFFRRTRGYAIEDNHYVMRREPERHMAGGAGITSTAGDIARFDMALDAGKILSPEFKSYTETPYKTASGKAIPYAYGRYIQYVNGEKIIWHAGWDPDIGFSATYLKFPERNLTVIVLANSEGLWWGSPLDKAQIEKSVVFRKVSEIFAQ